MSTFFAARSVRPVAGDYEIAQPPARSNDNPFTESQFKTLKYRADVPNRFGSQEDARDFCQGFFAWYNQEHYHSVIGLLTPASVHYGDADAILVKRQAVLAAAYARRPERFVLKTLSPPEGPMAVWINPPPRAMQTSHGVDALLFEILAACEPVKPKSELEISRLTSAEASTRPQIPPSGNANLNPGAHENGLPETKDLKKLKNFRTSRVTTYVGLWPFLVEVGWSSTQR